MKIIYRGNDWGFRIKKDGANYWLGYMNEERDNFHEVRIQKEIYLALKLWWRK